MIVHGHRISHMNKAIRMLREILQEWKTAGDRIPEVDWSSRMRSLEFQETLRARNELVSRLPRYACILCSDFERHVSRLLKCSRLIRTLTVSTFLNQYAMLNGEKVLRANVAQLKLAISDQNLELIPDYEQRIEVLKELKFIDDNSTVLLKGRVACEVCITALIGTIEELCNSPHWFSR